MRDPLAELAWHDRDNRPVADPARLFDYAERRLKRRLERMRAREAMAELLASGVTLSLRNGRLCAGPPERIVNGTRQRIEQYRVWFVELLQEVPT